MCDGSAVSRPYARLAVAAAALTCWVGVPLVAAGGSTAEISGARAKAFVAELARLGPRPAGSTAERRAGLLVEQRLRRLGYRIVIQTFPLPRGGFSRNILGVSSRRPRVIVVAHLDGVRAGPAANDNGSGVAALLEVARGLRASPGVWVAALGAEERVETGSSLHLGSDRLVRGLSRAGRRGVRLALSLDMVGVGPTLNVRGLERSPNHSARLALAHSRAAALGATYRPDTGQSDHTELTRGGVPAAWIQWRWDPCWHRACDVASRVQAWKVAGAAKLTLLSARAALRGAGG